jgi:hypothetical protein
MGGRKIRWLWLAVFAPATLLVVAEPAWSATITRRYEITGGTSTSGPIPAGGFFTVRYTLAPPGATFPPTVFPTSPATLVSLFLPSIFPTLNAATPNQTKLVGVPGFGLAFTTVGSAGMGQAGIAEVSTGTTSTIGGATLPITATKYWGAGWASDLSLGTATLHLTYSFQIQLAGLPQAGTVSTWSFSGSEVAVPEAGTFPYLLTTLPLLGGYLLVRGRRSACRRAQDPGEPVGDRLAARCHQQR